MKENKYSSGEQKLIIFQWSDNVWRCDLFAVFFSTKILCFKAKTRCLHFLPMWLNHCEGDFSTLINRPAIDGIELSRGGNDVDIKELRVVTDEPILNFFKEETNHHFWLCLIVFSPLINSIRDSNTNILYRKVSTIDLVLETDTSFGAVPKNVFFF